MRALMLYAVARKKQNPAMNYVIYAISQEFEQYSNTEDTNGVSLIHPS